VAGPVALYPQPLADETSLLGLIASKLGSVRGTALGKARLCGTIEAAVKQF